MTSAGVSIVIPTHNRAALLARALDSLAQVEVPPGLDVEVVVVANACTDDTGRVVAAKAGALGYPVLAIEEVQANANVARNRGVRAARGGIVALVDDDVQVERGWLRGLMEVYEHYPADLVGGRVELAWEAVERPAWFAPRHEKLLARMSRGDAVLELHRRGDVVGANMSFRREAFDALGGFRPGLDRSGTRLLGGGDIEFTQRALQRGFRVFYAPGAVVWHWVSAERITRPYLAAVAYGQGEARVYMDPKLSAWRAARTVASAALRFLGNVPVGLFHRARRDRRREVDALIRRSVSLGKLVGSLRWLAHRPSVPRQRPQVP